MIHGHHQMCSTQPAEYPKPQQSLVAFQSPSRLLPESISEVSFLFRQYATHNTLVCGKSIISQTSLCYLPPRQGRWFTENISSQKEITCSRFSLARVIAPVSPERQKHEGVKFSELSFVPFLGKVMQDPVKAPLHPSHVLNINFKHSPRTTEAHVRVIDWTVSSSSKYEGKFTLSVPPAWVLQQVEVEWGRMLLPPHLCKKPILTRNIFK